MQDPKLIDDPTLMARLRSLTTEVGEKELAEFIHYAHIEVLRDASHRLGLFVLVRRTNPESIKFVGYPGFVPKPLAGFQLLPDRDIDRHALGTLPPGCAYIHGDYDLYALVHKDNLSGRNPRTGKFDGVDHRYGENWKAFEALVRGKLNLDMIQHGSQEHFGDHSDETVDMFCPTVDRRLWHVKVEGAGALARLYEQGFEGRRPLQSTP